MSDFAMDSWQVVVFLLITSLVAGTVRGITGFGGPAIMLLSLTQMFSPASVLHLVVIADYSASVQLAIGALRQVLWRSILPLILASFVGISFGLYLLTSFDPTVIKRAIAFVVGICSVVMLVGWRYHVEPHWLVAVAVGLFGGAIVGLTYIALPIMIFLFSGPALAAVSRAHAVTWGCISSSLIIVVLAFNGLFGFDDLGAVALVTCAYMTGAFVGARLFRRFSEKMFRRIVLWLLIALSVLGLVT